MEGGREEREPPNGTTLHEASTAEAEAVKEASGDVRGEENQSLQSTPALLDESSSSAPAADFDTAAATTGLRQRVPPSRRAVRPSSSSSSATTRPTRRGRTRKSEGAAGEEEVGQKKDLRARVGGALADSVRSVGARMFLMLILVIVGLVIAAMAAFAFCWAFFPVATTPIAGLRALASLETVTLGGVEQSILLRAEDTANPIVLLLHGGPGLPLMPFREGFAALEKDFLVVYWDQYGSGKSCDWSTFLASPSSSSSSSSAATAHDHHHRPTTGSEESTDAADADDEENGKPTPSRPAPCRRCRAHRHDRFGDFDDEEELVPQRSVDLASTFQDAEELVQYLCRRFHQPAVTLVAHDSGSVVAMRLAQQHPELVRSVFLVAPLIDFDRQHEALLAWALDKARRERQFPILAQLETTTGGGRGGVALPLANATQLVKLRRAVADLGGDMRKGGFVLKLLHYAFAASEYSVGDKLTLAPCGIQSAAHQFNDLRQVNLTEQVRAVKVPVGMACGKWDRVTPCAVVEDYLRLLRSASTVPASPAPTSGENDAAAAPSPEPPTEQGASDVIVFAKSAHWPFIEEGATFAERLREHLSASR